MANASTSLNRWLTRACAILIVIDLLHIPLGLASIPSYYERVTTLTIPVYGLDIDNLLTNNSVVELAQARGMTLPTFAVYMLGVQLLASLIFTGVGGLVLWRARGHWFGWFTAHVMFFLNSFALFPIEQIALLVPSILVDLVSVFWPTVILYFFLFPNGRFTPRWLRIPVVIYAVVHFTFQAMGLLALTGYLPADSFEFIVAPANALIAAMFVTMLASQIYRYWRVSSSVERAQTRWFLLGVAVLVLVPFDSFEWSALSLTIAPITLAIAILRYRLWDIDVIIRRTLQYSVLTGLLALTYFGSVVALQSLVSAVGGRQTAVVTVITTLGIAALFTPLRRRVQDFIDRRFYRKKYNAEQALAQFAATARDEVDMDKLAAALIGVVEETMQPEKVSLWLKESAPARKGMATQP